MSVKWVVHDVLQQTKITHVQKKRGISNRNDLLAHFKDIMKLLEGTETTLLCLSEGVNDTEWVDYIKEHPEWKVQCHGIRHFRYDEMSTDQMYKEMLESKGALEQTFKTKVTEFYCPYNKYSDITRRIAAKCGMEEVRRFRRPTHFKRSWLRCNRMDFHYWTHLDTHCVRFLKSLIDPEIIYIIGAPRSGTTAYMRWLRDETPYSLALKEREHIWADGFDRARYYATALADNGRNVLIDKNCRNSYRLPQMLDEFPGAKVHHVIRDGRAVALSWLKWARKTKKQDQTLEGAAQQWVDYVTFIREHLPAGSVELRYEDMCNRYEYFRNRNFKWHKELSNRQLATIQDIQGPLLKELNYL